jgi:hypothetical protein
MSIRSTNGDLHGNCSVMKYENGEFFFGDGENVPLREV